MSRGNWTFGWQQTGASEQGAATQPVLDEEFSLLRQAAVGVRTNTDADDLKSALPQLR